MMIKKLHIAQLNKLYSSPSDQTKKGNRSVTCSTVVHTVGNTEYKIFVRKPQGKIPSGRCRWMANI
jgi:hypothetical protein